MTWTANVVIWGEPSRPWWTYLGRERKWRYAIALALASLLAGCATCRPGTDMTQAQCDQLQKDLQRVEAPQPATAASYDFGAGKKPNWGANQ